MLTHWACQSLDVGTQDPTCADTATTPNAALTRKANEPTASGAHTSLRSASTACAQTEAPVLMLKSTVPANCAAADSHSALPSGPDRTSWTHAALVKNQEPMKQAALAAPAPASAEKPGAVPVAKQRDPMTNNQHWCVNVTIAGRRVLNRTVRSRGSRHTGSTGRPTAASHSPKAHAPWLVPPRAPRHDWPTAACVRPASARVRWPAPDPVTPLIAPVQRNATRPTDPAATAG